MMKHSNRQFGDEFWGFGCQSEKFSSIGACIRSNFTPFHLKSCNFYVFQISWTCCRPLSLCKCFWKRKWKSYRYLATIPVSVGDFPPKICKMAYHGKTTLGLNSIVGICFRKSTITIFIFSNHKCFFKTKSVDTTSTEPLPRKYVEME